MMPLTAAAASYVNAGLHVLALTRKRPNTRFHPEWSYENSIHGTVQSDADIGQLEGIFGHTSTTGVAICIPPHVCVADIDTEDAAQLFMSLAGSLPNTPVAKTPNGLHVWYYAPGAASSVWIGGRTLLFKGLGGYVVAPPSRHFDESGKFVIQDGVYTWLVPLISDGMIRGIDYLPDAITERIAISRALNPAPNHEPEERWTIEVEFLPAGGWRLWKRWNISGLCRAIIEAPDGNQNNIVAWAAMQARDEGVPYEVAMPQLLDAALQGNHPRDRAKGTIRGAYKRAARK